MEPITRTMSLNRVTKGAARFGEVPAEGEPEAFGQIYLKRWALGSMLKSVDVSSGYPVNIDESDIKIVVTVK